MPVLVVPSKPIVMPSASWLAVLVELPSCEVYVFGFSGATQGPARGTRPPEAAAARAPCAASTCDSTLGSRRRIDARAFFAGLPKLENERTCRPRLPATLDVRGASA